MTTRNACGLCWAIGIFAGAVGQAIGSLLVNALFGAVTMVLCLAISGQVREVPND